MSEETQTEQADPSDDSRAQEQEQTVDAATQAVAWDPLRESAEAAQRDLEAQLKALQEGPGEWRNPYVTEEAAKAVADAESTDDLVRAAEEGGFAEEPQVTGEDVWQAGASPEGMQAWIEKTSRNVNLRSPFEPGDPIEKPEDLAAALNEATTSEQIADVMERAGLRADYTASR